MIFINLGKRIKNIRESKGLSQEAVFKGIVSNSHYSNIETGRYKAATETLKLIAARLGVPKDYLTSTNLDCCEIQSLLDEFEVLVGIGNIKDTKLFLKLNKEKLEYIQSLKQEAYYKLLYFLHLLNTNKYNEALDLFVKYPMEDIQSMFDVKQKRIYLYANGLYYYLNSSHKRSIAFFKELLIISDDTSIYKPKVLYNIAMSLYFTYKFSESIDYAKESKLQYLKLHEWEKVGDCYNLLVVLNREIKNYSLAKTYLEKGFNIAKPDSFELKAKLFHNASLLYFDEQRYMKALEKVDKSLNIKKENFLPGTFVSLKLKLNILLNIDDLSLINKTFKIAYDFIDTEIQEGQYLYIKAKKHYFDGELDIYESNIQKVIKILLREKSWKELRTAAEHYSLFLEKKKKYKKSLEILKISHFAMENMFEGEDFL
ncbi:helix-turn-helix domain-containing protein [Sporosarcina cyprini]|uniref:helix-turn-helix domain-containing protein n=1 Tax=Sporosarcina cyprini TaxID=2910523 RepID=UPI001EDDF58A|nr:helix-turn-helix transcriptional regulator [Sporosarcina cyprini]